VADTTLFHSLVKCS